jgi:hypothetical protein
MKQYNGNRCNASKIAHTPYYLRRVLTCICSILLVISIAFRIIYINSTSEKIDVLIYPQGEWGDLSGNYILDNKEETKNYSFRINECWVSLYSDYSDAIDKTDNQIQKKTTKREELSRIPDDTPVINVNLTIRNSGTENGSLRLAEIMLTSRAFNTQAKIDFDIMKIMDDKIKELQMISLRPNTEYTLTIPFLLRDLTTDELSKNNPFYLAVTKYPNRILMECQMSKM